MGNSWLAVKAEASGTALGRAHAGISPIRTLAGPASNAGARLPAGDAAVLDRPWAEVVALGGAE
jgi:hypothetical protein